MQNIVLTAIRKNNLILLCQRSMSDSYPGLWTLPGGGIESFDTCPETAAKRETKEETNIDCYNLQLLSNYINDKNYNTYLFESYNWYCEPKIIPPETIGIGWFEINKLYKLKSVLTPWTYDLLNKLK